VIRLTTTSENNVLQYLFTLLIDTLEHDYILGNYIYASQVTSLILSEIYLKEKSSEMDRLNHKLTRVIRYMISNLTEELTLDQISEDMEISKSYLNSIFKKYTSHSPMDYFIHLRIQQACKYLKMTNMRIYEVSSKLGYRDPCYFSRLFKQVVGLSPRDYKRQNETVMITDDDLLTAVKR
jgi:YesN/AraC family two-component response regulator